MEKINVAVVGYGGMGRYHANHIEEFEKFNLVGIYDIKQSACDVATEKGVYVYPSFEALLEDERIELIVCATYNDCHKDIAIRAMKAGKAVISEKPVTMCSEDLEEMIKASEETGKLFTVHQNRRRIYCFATRNIYSNALCVQRRHPAIRANVGSSFDEDSTLVYNSRLIGRSVWNSEWWVLIPAASLNADAGKGKNAFLDNVKDIHPSYKWIVGDRLARLALAKDYEKTSIVYSGPIYKRLKVEGKKVIIEFDHTHGGLKTTDGKAPDWFTVKLNNGRYSKPQTAVIEGNTVVLTHDRLDPSGSVRFAWDEVAMPNLVNGEGLPACPFSAKAK